MQAAEYQNIQYSHALVFRIEGQKYVEEAEVFRSHTRLVKWEHFIRCELLRALYNFPTVMGIPWYGHHVSRAVRGVTIPGIASVISVGERLLCYENWAFKKAVVWCPLCGKNFRAHSRQIGKVRRKHHSGSQLVEQSHVVTNVSLSSKRIYTILFLDCDRRDKTKHHSKDSSFDHIVKWVGITVILFTVSSGAVVIVMRQRGNSARLTCLLNTSVDRWPQGMNHPNFSHFFNGRFRGGALKTETSVFCIRYLPYSPF